MKNGLSAFGEAFASFASRTAVRHPKQITAVVAAAFLFAGGGAFAVASLVPNTSDVPVQQVLESVKPMPIGVQTAALEAFGFTLFRSDLTRSSDTAESLLRRLGIADPEAAAFIRKDPEARAAVLGRAGRTITVEATQDSRLQKLSARWIPESDGGFRRVLIEKSNEGYAVRTEVDDLVPGTRMASGAIRSSLFAAADDARVPDPVASQLVDIFAGDVDFQSLRKGDRFSVVYETMDADGQSLRSGRVLAAEFETNGKLYQAVWFQEGQEKGAYYRPSGESLRKSYLSSPVEFTRVSSGFAMRMHPIQKTWRKHNGVDYAAPSGTPVRAIGDGVVEFAGRQNGYGNFVVIKHRNNQSTAYAHLSRIDVKEDQKVSQGDFIGAVGSTGWATGPHLHFEFRINDEYVDPSAIAQQEGGVPIGATSRKAFEAVAKVALVDLAAAGLVVQAAAQ